jgi:hypothetical protein
MLRKLASFWAVVFLVSMLVPLSAMPQNFTASINGVVTDPSGAVIPGAEMTLTSISTGWTAKFSTANDGLFLFGNLTRGVYTLNASAKGFRDVVQKQIVVNLNESVRVDVKMELGPAVQTVEVRGTANALNFDNGEVKGAITPETIADLPLIVSGNQRAAASFIILLPGVNTGGGANPFDSRINGGIQGGDEAVLDGVTMQEGVQSQSGMVAMFNDYPITPESVSEVSVLKSNYEPQYGYTSSAVITAVTKSGTNQFHGSGHELLRNKVLNSRSFNTPQTPIDTENDWGATIGGPAKIPGLWGGNRKAYFFFAYGGYTIRGGTVSSILSLPSILERQGDFSDWTDSSGNLIPIYDPKTTRDNPAYNSSLPVGPTNQPYLRDQFMGCNGNTPNVICPNDPRLQNSLANQWIKFLPNPTFAGTQNNYVGLPLNIGFFPAFNRVAYDGRVDEYLGDKDHFSVEIHFHQPTNLPADSLPFQLATSAVQTHGAFVGPTMDRINWDHTFSPTLLNNVNFGYTDYRGKQQCLDQSYAGSLPQIAGVTDHNAPPTISFQDFTSFGCNVVSHNTKPNTSVNDMMTWVRGKHTLKFGVDLRRFQYNERAKSCGSGCFSFDRLNTGLSGIPSGNSFASFLLEQVASANINVYTLDGPAARQHSLGLHIGDTWKVKPKLSLNYGLRWDTSSPSYENFDRLSFFNPNGTNPGAGGRLGSLAFAGTRWGSASFGARYPEKQWLKAFAPRLGFAYTLTPKTVARGGYGMFFTQAYYPSWGGGMRADGFNSSPSVSSSEAGIQAGMVLSQGFPQNFQQPPFIDPSFDNGQAGPLYRPFDANRLSYAQQWNLTIERQFSETLHVNAAYVANKGTRLPSYELPLNVLNPSLLASMGQNLNDTFTASDTSLDGVPIPYPGWVQQMQACAPTVAQALVPYPQYCGSLVGLNENAGNSTYHSFQLQVENRFSHNIYLLGSYTLSKLLTSSDFVTPAAETWSGAAGAISPYERKRNKALSTDNVPQTLSVALLYKLPFGHGQRFLSNNAVLDKLVGGWEATNIFRASGGTPFVIRSSVCNVPSQFGVGCIPGIIPGANPWALGAGKFSSTQPIFNASAFESPSSFNFYYGQGPRVSSLRGPGYHNYDFGLIKDTRLTEKVTLQFRGEFFNIFNWHVFNCVDQCFGSTAFNTDVASPNFGSWTGSVTAPRNIQLGMEILF